MRALLPLMLLLAALVLAALGALFVGLAPLPPSAVLRALASSQPDLAGLVVREIRLPRVILALLVGAILGLSGAVLQGLLRNPLAEPGLLGISAGAALGAVLAIYYGFAASFAFATPLFALTGAGIAAAAVLALARGGGTLALILAGAAISSTAFALVYLALDLAPNPYATSEMLDWLMGSLAERSWDHVRLAAPFILAGGALLLLTAPGLDALALGELQAESLGVPVARLRLLALAGTALGVGAAAAVAGTIGFVGLVAPHLVRPLVGHRPARVLLPAALAGALLVLVADTATRLIVTPGPPLGLGVLISLVGAPFFLWLVLRMRGRAA
ncbi:MAG: iron ABC transporter permease [Sphingomonadales bacterium]|nr:iron ABC transporter permease [Sphingomonadales bacterium]